MPELREDSVYRPTGTAVADTAGPAASHPASVFSRRSLGFRLLITVVGVIGVALGFTALVAGLLVPVRSEMSRLADDAVPRAVLASKIDRQSAFVAAQASVLVLAKVDRVRAAAYERIGDELRGLDEYLAELAALPRSSGRDLPLQEVRVARQGLADSFEALDGLVAERIRLETRLEDALADLIDAAPIDPPWMPGRGVGADDAMRQVGRAVQELPSALIGNHEIALERLAETLRARFERARAVIYRNPALDAEIARIEAVAFGERGMITLRRRLFGIERSIDGWLRENRTRSDILRAAAASLLGETADRAAGLGARINTDIGRIWVLAMMAAAILILAGFGIASRIYNLVLVRLAVVHNALGAHSLEPGTRFNTDGDDEIADIAEALERFVETIAAREAELRTARETALQAVETRARFLANMSHELRTPMTGILGMADLLLAGNLTPEQRERLVALRASADLLMALLNDVLDYSKIEAGRLELERTAIAVVPLVERAVRLFEPQAIAKGLSLRTEMPEAPLPLVLGDPYRLQQVVLNLVNNAVKFTERGGVTVRLLGASGFDSQTGDRAGAGAGAGGGFKDGPGADAGPTIVLEVADSGIGMSEEQQSRLFQAFCQADASTTRRYGGTGLGLAITAHLVQLMGGTITCRSTPQIGSAFRVELPFEPAAAERADGTAVTGVLPALPSAAAPMARPVPAVTAVSARPSLRLLLADDNPINRTLLCAMLQRDGHHVESVTDGGAALAALEAGSIGGHGADRRYDLALLDIQMPELDGVAVVRRFRAGAATARRLPIVALTANATVEQADSYRRAGFDAVIAKPIDWTLLRDTMDGLTGGAPGGLAGAPTEAIGSPLAEARGQDGSLAPLTARKSAVPVEAALIDHQALAEVAELVGRTDFVAMLEAAGVHLQEASLRLQRLEDAMAADPEATPMMDDLPAMVHTLAGMGSSLGFTRLTAEASACELALRHGSAAGPRDRLLDLHAVILRTQRALAEVSSGGGAMDPPGSRVAAGIM